MLINFNDVTILTNVAAEDKIEIIHRKDQLGKRHRNFSNSLIGFLTSKKLKLSAKFQLITIVWFTFKHFHLADLIFKLNSGRVIS